MLQEGSKSHLVVGRPCIARKIGFPELILPNDVRNDLYVNIFSAELSRLNKTADRNVEVSASLVLYMEDATVKMWSYAICFSIL